MNNACYPILSAIASVILSVFTTTYSYIPAGTNPYAVAVNPVTNRVYVANYGSGTITVINGSIHDTMATITVGSNPRAIAVNALTNKIYAANFTASSISIIDGASNTVSATVSVGSMPNAIAVNPATNRVYVTNYGGASVSVINGSTDAVDTTLPVGTGPIAVCVNPVTNRIYVANSGSNTVSVINGSTYDTASVAVGTNPSSVAANTVTNKIYAANQGSNNVTVIDGSTLGTTTITVGTSPCAVAVNLVTDTVYVVNSGSNNVTVIDGASGTVVSTVTVGTNPVALAISTTMNKVYMANYGSKGFSVIYRDVIADSLAVGTNPNAVAVNTIMKNFYLANYGSGNVTELIARDITTSIVPSRGYPRKIAINPITNKIYIANSWDGWDSIVTVIDGVTNDTEMVGVGLTPHQVAINPITNKIYIDLPSRVLVIDGETNDTATVAIKSSSGAIAIDIASNKIYFGYSKSSKGYVTVLDGSTDTLCNTIFVGKNPSDIAVNPVTNKIYAAISSDSTVRVIDCATLTTATISLSAAPVCVAVNPVTNKIYVGYFSTNYVTIINGATNVKTNVTVSNGPCAIDINVLTNKIYVANAYSLLATIIDGETNGTINISADSTNAVAVNPVTNNIYFTTSSLQSIIKIFEGLSNYRKDVLGSTPCDVAVNPVTNKAYTANWGSHTVSVIGETPQSDTKLNVIFDSLPGHSTLLAQPALSGKAVNRLRPGRTGISSIFSAKTIFGLSKDNISIINGSGTDSVSFTYNWGTDSLLFGENFLCAVAFDSQTATINNQGLGTSFAGNVAVYLIYRLKQASPPAAVSDAPTLISPVNGAVNQPTAPTFVWNSSARAISYTMQVSTDSVFDSLVYSWVFSLDTTQTVTGLDSGTTYFWRVSAYNSGGLSPWSSVWSFSTIIDSIPVPPPDTPSTPTLSSPINNALGVSTNPLLSWNSAARAASYTVQVATDSNFSTIIVNDSGVTDIIHMVTGLSTFTFYYWRVRAVNTGGTSAWSTVWNFVTGATGVLPSKGNLPAAFSISGSSGTVRYSLPVQCRVSLKYYDLRGRLVAALVNTTQGAGYYALSIKKALPSRGTYIRVFEAGNFVKRELTAIVGR